MRPIVKHTGLKVTICFTITTCRCTLILHTTDTTHLLALLSATGSTLCYWLYYRLSTQDLMVPVMYSLRVCKVVLMHNRLT